MSEGAIEELLRGDPTLRAGIERTLRRARETGRTRWMAHVIATPSPDPLECIRHVGARDRFLWQQVESDVFFCAWGVVDETESSGTSRFDDVRAWTARLRERIDWTGDPRPANAPLFLGGFGFEDAPLAGDDWKSFPAARFVLPEVIVERWNGLDRRILLVRVEPGATRGALRAALADRLEDVAAVCAPGMAEAPGDDSEDVPQDAPGPEFVVRADRAHATFRAQIRRALAEIEAGRFAKVVLARSLTVEHDHDFDEAAFFERLRALYPSCTLVAIGRASDTFVAATPEQLVRVDGRDVETAALAGSAPRGRHPAEDRALAETLLGSAKENAEHAHVVDALRAVLGPRCATLEIGDSPRIRRLFGIQHLETPVVGRLAPDPPEAAPTGRIDLLELVRALHPTPAVGGFPTDAARAWLRRSEGLERGWYAAPVGWLDLEGGGDFRVALRSALIRNRQGPAGTAGASRALLFGGVGLVHGSDAEAELVETRIKLRALLAPLTEI